MKAPTELASYRALAAHARTLESTSTRALFDADPKRFERLSIDLADLIFDYSKHRVADETMRLLVAFAEEAGVPEAIRRMFAGEKINATEGRAVFHVALRADGATPRVVDGKDVMPDVLDVRRRMAELAEGIRTGEIRGHGGERFTDLLHIGIGGSDLGPRLVADALHAYVDGPRPHFVSNVDGQDLLGTLAELDPRRTLLLVASKTFTTEETLRNAESAKAWLVRALGANAIGDHSVALSTNVAAAGAFGVRPERVLPFWDWVGGRFSLWSSVGTALPIALGEDRFEELLAGAREVDEHLRSMPLGVNIPVVMALLGFFHQSFSGATAHAVLPYDQSLRLLPAWLQQLDMESNGKRVRTDGSPVVGYDTSPIVFGEPGTNGQHAFYQLLHQGTRVVPCDFLAPIEPLHELREHHEILLAHFLAQPEALMNGRDAVATRALFAGSGLAPEAVERLVPHQVFPGSRPTSTFVFDRITPQVLGRLLALYEHKVFVQGVLFGVNSFDQFGVELGKRLAKTLLAELRGDAPIGAHDGSTAGLLARVRGRRQARR